MSVKPQQLTVKSHCMTVRRLPMNLQNSTWWCLLRDYSTDLVLHFYNITMVFHLNAAQILTKVSEKSAKVKAN